MGVKLVHYTHKDNLPKILATGMIFDQLRRNKKNIKVGEGDLSRTCCYPTNSYNTRPGKCTEGCGLYFRVVKPGQKVQRPFSGYVAMVFNASILSRYKWHINFCENNGLWIDDGIAHLGNEDVCPNSSSKKKDMMDTDFEQLDGEIIIYESIDLRDLDYVVDRSMERVGSKSQTKSQSRRSQSKSKSKNRKSMQVKTTTNTLSRRRKTV